MKRAALKAAFPCTVPIMAAFLFLGFTYGVVMHAAGFSFWWPTLISLLVYAGSLQFVAVELLVSVFDPLAALLMALMVNARHLFYSISMLDKFRGTGWKKPYMIYALCDESFSVNYAVEAPEGIDRGWFMFFNALLIQSYWVIGSAAGGLAGAAIPFNTEGLDFSMTALFVVIFLEQWLKEKDHTASLVGVGVSIVMLLAFGPDSFLIPSMLCLLAVLTLLRGRIERRETL